MVSQERSKSAPAAGESRVTQCTVGLHGAFGRTDRGQPMQIYDTPHPVYPLDLQPDEIDIRAIAHSLSLQCRFSGHVREFYSVAQHCVLVSWNCGSYPKEGLLHDASEAYLSDVSKPIKVELEGYIEAEGRIEQAIAQKWGLRWPWPEEVKHADIVLLATEKRDLMVPPDLDWGPLPTPLQHPIQPWSPRVAERTFLQEAERYGLFG